MAAKNADLIACLLLHQQRRDNALGLAHITTSQKGLLWYYNRLQRDMATKLFYYGVIVGARKRIEQIKRKIKKSTPLPEARQLYQEALILQDKITEAYEIING